MTTLQDLKIGSTILHAGAPHEVLSSEFTKVAQRRPTIKAKLRNLETGQVRENTFQQGETIESADVERKIFQYLYQEGEQYTFMDNETYEQISFPQELVGKRINFIKESGDVQVLYFDGKAINISLPIKVDLKVKEAPPAVKGDTANAATKTITLETGYSLQTPLFIKPGDTVRVNTQTGEYVERV